MATDNVLVAGIAGASLGTELAKCLALAARYRIFGCDISPHAYGLYDPLFDEAHLLEPADYGQQLLNLCKQRDISIVLPGGQRVLSEILPLLDEFEDNGVVIATNDPGVVARCTDKGRFFQAVDELGFPRPWTLIINGLAEFEAERIPGYPCIAKPSSDSGFSRFALIARDRRELEAHLAVSIPACGAMVVQEYVPADLGEFTIGVLTLPRIGYSGSLAIRQIFDAKLTVRVETDAGIISSGYSQGVVEQYPEVRAQAEELAMALGSDGPMNIQARLRQGTLLPFEANPRFSGSTYLRAMAGFNAVDDYVQYLLHRTRPPEISIRPGCCLRSFTETFVPQGSLRT